MAIEYEGVVWSKLIFLHWFLSRAPGAKRPAVPMNLEQEVGNGFIAVSHEL